MACHFNDNVYTQTFTPREYQVELLDTAKEKNTIICCNSSGAKTFIAVKLLQEISWQMRHIGGKRAIFILDKQNGFVLHSHIKYLTDLRIIHLLEETISDKWHEYFTNHDVIVTTIETCNLLLAENLIDLNKVNLLVIDDCLYGERQKYLEPLISLYKKTGDKPRILGLAAGLFTSKLKLELLEFELQRLEKLLCSSVDTSSELVTLLQLCSKPNEKLIECPKMISMSIQEQLEDIVLEAREFLQDHRFDPSEIYGEFVDELKLVPNPTEQPIQLLNIFLEILRDLGPWAANEAALTLLSVIEKLKIKIPYERHFLLLGIVTTIMVKIRAICEQEFQGMSNLDSIIKYSAPKIMRFLELIKTFKPSYPKPIPVEEPPQPTSTGTKVRGKLPRNNKRMHSARPQQEDSLCAIVFVRNRFTAKVLYTLLYLMSQSDDFWWVSALYSVEKIADPINEPREAENEHRRQEEVLRRFRIHDCNIMVSTSILEQGCDLPKCNLVVHFDTPTSFHSYIQSKARARGADAYYVLMVNEGEVQEFSKQLSEYMEVEKTLLKRCPGLEPEVEEERQADRFSTFPIYKPLNDNNSPNVTFSTAIALVNRYCAKLPSDTFTRLTPLWTVRSNERNYICKLRLPINSPLKQQIYGPSMPNRLLACRAAAYKTCMLLHLTGELDDQLQPIGKENFRANEDDWRSFTLEAEDEALAKENVEARPGTTKRRQYYYKRIADALTLCCPQPNEPTYFYRIVMTLTCPLPEEQNTRGRKIYPPEDSSQGFGILTAKKIPEVCAFPIFTRSGEVKVSLELCSSSLILSEEQITKISEFLNYTFTSVLRLQRYLMLFDPKASENSFLIAPTRTDYKDNTTTIDWEFLDLIDKNNGVLPRMVPENERADYKFDPADYRDAVVMPWYRNQDQPQYFYVAEICSNLNPKSSFPGSEYTTFEEYYLRKYSINIQNSTQHLLDVDHTSARLNFLTPRYVNRKGVALPTSSEETKRAKRENLEQKQILVPELCAIHPFPASLWRKAVCLPCILYRLNAFLLADQIRRTVALELGLGQLELSEGFTWPALNFGWNLANVLRKGKEEVAESVEVKVEEPKKDLSLIEKESESEDEKSKEDWVEIGTWSNDMIPKDAECNSMIRYASPTSWLNTCYDYTSGSENSDSSDEDSECGNGLRIEFTGDNTAEAVEEEVLLNDTAQLMTFEDAWINVDSNEDSQKFIDNFNKSCEENMRNIMSSKVLISKELCFEKNEEIKNGFCKNIIDNNLHINMEELELSKVKECLKKNDNSNNIESITIQYEYEISENDLQFRFDAQPDLEKHPGPSPSVILQALTMSNANDGINLERLETIGDSFLKYAITNYLYSKYENVHEGKLSHLRSKQVSNLNLYRLGKYKAFGECMIATKFDPHDNWLPPCYYIPKKLEDALIDACVPANYWSPAEVAATREMTIDEICQMVRVHGENLDIHNTIPYNIVTQHSIPDKSIADCVEALIGAYLIDCGPRGALLFMAWLGMKVLPQLEDGSFGELEMPKTPLLNNVENPHQQLQLLFDGYDKFEEKIGYRFQDRAYLIQALTHASYSPNTVTDCYQRLEFLGDAVLDYLITRHLYEDKRMHSPGALTDLRSALVNNTIFASLAVKHGFHYYFRHLSPGLHEVVERFVRIQEETGHPLVEELYLLAEYECEEVEDVEVPKALGDVFESVAGAIFLDSGMSLDAVWGVYYEMMKNEIERFSDHVPKSPIRELLEMEPETAKFGKPEKLADGRRVRVTVEVFGKGLFKGIGRNYRIAKCTAAKCALKHLKRRGGLINRN